jgi:hypothetical protein
MQRRRLTFRDVDHRSFVPSDTEKVFLGDFNQSTRCCYGDSNPSRERESRLFDQQIIIAPQIEEFDSPRMIGPTDNPRTILFTEDDLGSFVIYRSRGVGIRTQQVIEQITYVIWDHLKGVIDESSISKLADHYCKTQKSDSMLEKYFQYTRAFFTYLYKKRLDPMILAYLSIFEKPKTKKKFKLLTSRIIIDEDIRNALAALQADTSIQESRKANFMALIQFLAYSGQRPLTASKVSIQQLNEALASTPPVLKVEAAQDKIGMEHYVPLHPNLIVSLTAVINDTDRVWDRTGKIGGSYRAFDYLGACRWLREHAIQMKHTRGKLELKDLRKFFEQKSDEVGFNDANKNFIMSHGVSSINWQSYKQFLPENVYKRYMACWGDVTL